MNLLIFLYPESQLPLAPVFSSAKMEDASIYLSKAGSSLCVLDFFYSHPLLVFHSDFLFLSSRSFLLQHKYALVFLIFLTSHFRSFPTALFFLLPSQQNFYTCCFCFSHYAKKKWRKDFSSF